MKQHEIAHGVGPRQRVLELDDRRIYAIFGCIDDAEPIMRLLVVRIAREQLTIDRFGTIEPTLTIVEIAQEARRLGAVGMEATNSARSP